MTSQRSNNLSQKGLKFTQEAQNFKKQKKIKKKGILKEKGFWTDEEKQKYFCFVILNQESLRNSKLKRQSKVFKKMSHMVQTRDHKQCKSHHQKMIRKFYDLSNMIQQVIKKYPDLENTELNNKSLNNIQNKNLQLDSQLKSSTTKMGDNQIIQSQISLFEDSILPEMTWIMQEFIETKNTQKDLFQSLIQQ